MNLFNQPLVIRRWAAVSTAFFVFISFYSALDYFLIDGMQQVASRGDGDILMYIIAGMAAVVTSLFVVKSPFKGWCLFLILIILAEIAWIFICAFFFEWLPDYFKVVI